MGPTVLPQCQQPHTDPAGAFCTIHIGIRHGSALLPLHSIHRLYPGTGDRCPIKSSNILDGVPEIWAAPSSQVSSMSTRPKSKIYKISTELSAGQQQGSWLSTRWKYTALHHLQIRCTNERHPEEGANRSKPCRRMCSGPCVYLGSAVARFSCQWEDLGIPLSRINWKWMRLKTCYLSLKKYGIHTKPTTLGSLFEIF